MSMEELDSEQMASLAKSREIFTAQRALHLARAEMLMELFGLDRNFAIAVSIIGQFLPRYELSQEQKECMKSAAEFMKREMGDIHETEKWKQPETDELP